MATGHYVRRVDGPDGPELHRAADLRRDQSWFLFATTRAQLARTLFPLGGMPDKDAVRAEAARLGLEVAAKPDSQDICFVPIRPLRRRRGAPAAGRDGTWRHRDADGTVLGRHDGVGRYTVGQAKRLGAAAGGQRVVVSLDAGHAPGRGRAARHGHAAGAVARGQLAGAARRLALHGEAARPRRAACRQRDGSGGT